MRNPVRGPESQPDHAAPGSDADLAETPVPGEVYYYEDEDGNLWEVDPSYAEDEADVEPAPEPEPIPEPIPEPEPEPVVVPEPEPEAVPEPEAEVTAEPELAADAAEVYYYEDEEGNLWEVEATPEDSLEHEAEDAPESDVPVADEVDETGDETGPADTLPAEEAVPEAAAVDENPDPDVPPEEESAPEAQPVATVEEDFDAYAEPEEEPEAEWEPEPDAELAAEDQTEDEVPEPVAAEPAETSDATTALPVAGAAAAAATSTDVDPEAAQRVEAKKAADAAAAKEKAEQAQARAREKAEARAKEKAEREEENARRIAAGEPTQLQSLLATVHPRISIVTALVVLIGARVSDRPWSQSLWAGLAVLVTQLALGIGNDVADREADKKAGIDGKPIAYGWLPASNATFAITVLTILSVPLALQNGTTAGISLLLTLVVGYVHNKWLHRGPLSFVGLAVTYPLLVAFLAYGGWGLGSHGAAPTIALSALAAVLGVCVHFLLSLPDLVPDHRAGWDHLPLRVAKKTGATNLMICSGVLTVATIVALVITALNVGLRQ